jgi:glycosyltransferase involved in cell wall biosynthesis
VIVLDTPTISVIIPCYNAERYIAATIRSVLLQNWQKLEIVVVDDGSKDHSAQLVRDAFPDVKLVCQPNQGVAVARNTGIAQATGDWIAFLDADDIWLDGKLALQWAQLQANPGVRMNYTAWQVWQSIDAAPSDAFIKHLQSRANDQRAWTGASGWVYPDLLLDCVVWTSTVLAHRSVFEEVGNFDATLRIGEDYDLWLRASRVTQILRVPKPLALYRTHSASITKSAPIKNYQGVVIQRALDRWGLASPDGATADHDLVYKALAQTWSDFAYACLTAGQRSKAWQAATTSVKSYCWQLPGWKVLLKTILKLR